MNKQENRKYGGNGKKVGNYDLINLSIKKSKLEGHWFEYKGEHYVKLSVGSLKTPDAYGKTHSVWINEFKPDKSKANPDKGVEQVDLPEINDMPF